MAQYTNKYKGISLDDVRVGYIDSISGYVKNITIADAKKYAELNPETMFILEAGEDVKYFSINELENLKIEQLLRKNRCEGIQLDAPCNPPEAFFYGGGGVGAKGNPIIGTDGALLAIDIINPGNGYKEAPDIDIIDECGIGAGAVARAILCPEKERRFADVGEKGTGSVCTVVVLDPGNSYPQTQTPNAGDRTPFYPATLRLQSVIVTDPGIGYCNGNQKDKVTITPDNGAVLDYETDNFGRILRINVVNPGLGFTRYPDITIDSDCGGINATFIPVFEVIRDPITVDKQLLIQVTDLVGLKQTGYVDGRAFFGSVFFKDGVKYAGFYETPGELTRVYDTLAESISGRVTTSPSAIPRQGTDTQDNNPTLNLPG